MLTTIFTGHTLRLADIRAVSGVMIETRDKQPYYTKTLYLEIILAGTPAPIRLDHHRYNGIYNVPMSEQAKADWKEKTDGLYAKRDELIQQWQESLTTTPTTA